MEKKVQIVADVNFINSTLKKQHLRTEKLRRQRTTPRNESSQDRQQRKRLPESSVRNKLKRAERNVQYIAQTLTEMRQAEEVGLRRQFNKQTFDLGLSPIAANRCRCTVVLIVNRATIKIEADWQFISLVIDRILLFIFAFCISAGTLITILSAPSITDTRAPIITTY
ncbi:hypothetical protein OESDEN_00978 [Oesophagostomum dentatum]|uniref:Neurotransmitter-gated ion-channel transmembrane domain-containing protein n=1 Tax=Oesophagostomum dentatum TaxID=61180 RepID=A0A0B1TSD8_OESDE|nr:hypothetical protein OESDEN_00978 [Oesophagostomum dentatum]